MLYMKIKNKQFSNDWTSIKLMIWNKDMKIPEIIGENPTFDSTWSLEILQNFWLNLVARKIAKIFDSLKNLKSTNIWYNVLKYVGPRRDLYFLNLFCSYVRVYFQFVAFVGEHIWHKALLMGYSIRLELTRVYSLNDVSYYENYSS